MLLLTPVLFFATFAQSPQAAADGDTHKVQVSDPALAAQIAAQGGRLIGDYGSFKLYETAQPSQNFANDSQAELRDDYNVVFLNAGGLDTRKPEVQLLRSSVGSFTGKRMHLVQFAGPVQSGWLEQVEGTGVRIVTYIPQNAYLVYGDAQSIAQLQSLAASAAHIQWEAPYLDNYRVHPRARTAVDRSNGNPVLTFAVQMVDDPAENSATLQLLDQVRVAPILSRQNTLNYLNVVVNMPRESLALVAARPDVVSIKPYLIPRKMDERQDQIMAGNLSGTLPSGPGYLAFLTSKGFTQAQFTTSSFVVDVTDSGVDNGTTNVNHFGLRVTGSASNASRVVYNRLAGTPNPGSTLQGCDGHGNLDAHIVAGYNNLSGFPFADASGFHYGLGVCPFVKIGSSVIFDPNFTFPNPNNLQSQAYQSGARISANSWGADVDGDYDFGAQNYDALVRDAQPTGSTVPVAGNQEMVIVFAAGNAGFFGASTVGSPGSAKNVITVGAAENVNPFGGGSDSGGIGDSGSDSANDMIYFSSRGPTADGRHKPEIVAPGTHITGGVAQALNPGANGTAIACYDGSGVNGGPGGSIYFPLGQQFYTSSSGTSHSTPAIAGACALLRQYFINNFTNPPTPAMSKAFLVNSTRHLTGALANDTLWSDTQGMGEVNLGTAFDGTARLMRDQQAADLITASGQVRTFTGAISDTNKPFRVTLAWTDAPGSTTGNAYNNDLNLAVTVGGVTYKGNVFSGALSVAGGSADFRNNMESVFLPAGTSGNFSITVTGQSINSDGLPGNGDSTDQDFALVAYNATAVQLPIINTFGKALLAETCTPTNGAVDSGEAVTMSFSLRNIGSANNSNLVATLLATNGVAAPSGPQSYGALVAGGSTASNTFTFTAVAGCGQTITPTFQLQDGALNLGTVTFPMPLGAVVLGALTYSNRFDGVTAPALPAGWSSSNIGAGALWTTITSLSDTAPNAAFAPDIGATGESQLISESIGIVSGAAQLTFRQRHVLEASSSPSGPGYDGGVLEISINGGAFTDIIAAGGSFVTGGYNRTISSLFGNPLAGREAWSGRSSPNGFITTTVNLPAAAAAQNVRFKWRLGMDQDTSSTGWYVDTLTIIDGSYVCCSGAPPAAPVITGHPTNRTVLPGTNVSFTVNATGSPTPAFQWQLNGTNLAGATSNILLLTNIQLSNAGNYRAVITNASGTTNSNPALLKVLVAPSITSVSATVSNFSVSVQSITGLSYTLEYKNLFSDPVWTPVGSTVPGTGGVIVLNDPSPSLFQRFYRVRTD